ncbi:MAG: hypothetical protein IPM17_00075 [Verrucomicrobia bacterium]|nr:hypothetical protein [Verrucomicrobiota bacterium]
MQINDPFSFNRSGSANGDPAPSGIPPIPQTAALRVSSGLLTVTAAGLLLLAGSMSAAQITMERSTNLQTWQPHPVAPGQVMPDGSLVVPADQAMAAFRLRIAAGAGPVIAAADAPTEARAVAEDFVRALNARPAPDGETDSESGPVELGEVAALFYDPAHADGTAPAYVEFKLRRAPEPPRPPGDPNPVFTHNQAGPDPRPDAGSVTVCLHRGDVPVPASAGAGVARFEKLLDRVPPGIRVRLVRYDDSFMVAENEAGQPVASLGSAPYLLDPEILQIPPEGLTYETDGTTPPTGPLGPRIQGRAAATYAEFVAAWRTHPVFVAVRQARAAVAADAWDFAGAGPKTVEVPLRQTVALGSRPGPVQRADSSDPAIARVAVNPASGRAEATGVGVGEALVTLWYADGFRERCVVDVLGATGGRLAAHGVAPQEYIPGKQAGWTITVEKLVSKWSEQRKYNQVWNDPQMCPTTVSGCGPTAWAMFYGHWDRKGYPRLFGDTALADSPEFMRPSKNADIFPSILACLRSVFASVDEKCFPKLDRAATLPGMMHLGEQWAMARNVKLKGSYQFGVPYLSPGCRNRALDSLNQGKISIVGIGKYAHYPVAYGYRKWEWKTKKGKTLNTDHDLLLNMGWGSGHDPEWQGIAQLWYATNLRPE